MFSPDERLYTTPDLSVPAAEAILQQLRLEKILKRFGYLACGKQLERTNDIVVAPPLVTLGPPAPTRRLRPFGAHEAFTGWQRSKNIQIPKPKVCSIVPKSGIPGAPVKDLPYQRDAVGGVHHTKYGVKDVQRPDLFKPFQPLNSPQQLPDLKRERGKEAVESKLQATDLYNHMNRSKSRNTGRIQEGKKRKKKRKKEMEFLKWEASHEQYLDKSVTDLYEYVNNRDKTVHVNNGGEQKYREKIETQIKQGVQQRVDSFGQSGKTLTKGTPQRNTVPVLELEFEHKNVRTKHIFKK